MSFWKLWKKEMNGFHWISVFLMAVLIVFTEQGQREVFVWFSPGVAKWDSPFGIPMVSIFWLGLWAIFMTFYSLRHEWQTKSIYLLLSLPLKGYKVLGAKIAGILTGVIVLLTFAVGFFLLCWWEQLSRFHLPYLTAFLFGMTVALLLLITIFVLVTLCQFTFLTGKMFPRFQLLVSGIVFYLITNLLYKLLIDNMPVLKRWIPDLAIRFGATRFDAGLWFFLPLFVIGISFFNINSYLFERKIQL